MKQEKEKHHHGKVSILAQRRDKSSVNHTKVSILAPKHARK
nr:MAG TPA: hypothetical protein [Caudoviricetes sp.]